MWWASRSEHHLAHHTCGVQVEVQVEVRLEGLRAVSISSWHRSGLMMRARETHSGREEATMRRTGNTVTWDTSTDRRISLCYKPRDLRLQVPAAAVTVFGG